MMSEKCVCKTITIDDGAHDRALALVGWLTVALLLVVFWAPALAQPVGLEAAIDATLKNHPALYGKQAGIIASQEAAAAARTARYPALQVQIGVDRDEQRVGQLQLSQPLWAFGKIDRAIEAADRGIATEQADLHQLERSLIERTVTAWLNLYALQQQRQLRDDHIAAHEALFEQIESRQRGRLASEADVTLARSRLIQARALRDNLSGEITLAGNELFALTRIAITPTAAIDPQMLALPDNAELITSLINQSPLIAWKERQLREAEQAIATSEVAALPILSLMALQNVGEGQNINSDETQIFLMLQGNLDGMGLTSYRKLKQARARYLASEQDVTATRQELDRKIEALIATRELQQTLGAAYRESVSAIAATLDSYQRQYQAGRKAWLEVLNMQRELNDEQLKQLQAENEWRKATVTLVAMTGRFDRRQSQPSRKNPSTE
jgi:outer membrane protein, adhesin transport system